MIARALVSLTLAVLAGRGWAVCLVALLVLANVTIALAPLRARADEAHARAPDAATRPPSPSPPLVALRRRYLAVHSVIALADWMQGTHLYTLYSSYAAADPRIDPASLFLTGFASAAALAPLAGALVQGVRHGQREVGDDEKSGVGRASCSAAVSAEASWAARAGRRIRRIWGGAGGARAGCLIYCGLEVVINLLECWPHPAPLFVGRRGGL